MLLLPVVALEVAQHFAKLRHCHLCHGRQRHSLGGFGGLRCVGEVGSSDGRHDGDKAVHARQAQHGVAALVQTTQAPRKKSDNRRVLDEKDVDLAECLQCTEVCLLLNRRQANAGTCVNNSLRVGRHQRAKNEASHEVCTFADQVAVADIDGVLCARGVGQELLDLQDLALIKVCCTHLFLLWQLKIPKRKHSGWLSDERLLDVERQHRRVTRVTMMHGMVVDCEIGEDGLLACESLDLRCRWPVIHRGNPQRLLVDRAEPTKLLSQEGGQIAVLLLRPSRLQAVSETLVGLLKSQRKQRDVQRISDGRDSVKVPQGAQQELRIEPLHGAAKVVDACRFKGLHLCRQGGFKLAKAVGCRCGYDAGLGQNFRDGWAVADIGQPKVLRHALALWWAHHGDAEALLLQAMASCQIVSCSSWCTLEDDHDTPRLLT
mmetsp:Transcript_28613/g.68061  ORF Transcript_28613/g.68061 Transcript_28613/m.68061 type:complete len:432 (+) Transcript_28613:315-1610(+)